jgi:predicted Rossmann fold flavoprotein
VRVSDAHHDLIDLAIVGAGAAGLATAIFAARAVPGAAVVAFDGAARLGAKILVAGGGRCNVTNRRVTPADFSGATPAIVRRVLRAFDELQTVAFFAELGVPLHEEEYGKLFPDSNRAQSVLDGLLAEAARRGAQLRPAHRVQAVRRVTPEDPSGARFTVVTEQGEFAARAIVLATGGKSLPKTGSDGGGYELARSLGHSLIEPVPALAPLVLEGEFHTSLSGIAHDVELTVRAAGLKPAVVRGPMLWTHFGVSGPAAMDVSRHWHRAQGDSPDPTSVRVTANFVPGETFETIEAVMLERAAAQPRTTVQALLTAWLPARVAGAVLTAVGIDAATTLAHLAREPRRRLVHALLAFPLPVVRSRGYNYAEATAGGVPLTEVDPATMHSRCCDGLYLVGEVLDVDGRIGGFNFQWAWSSAFVAAQGWAQRTRGE